MSQAVSAPNTGEPFVTGGKSADVTASRRGLLAGLALAGVALPMAAQAHIHADVLFWAAHARWAEVDRAWQAALDRAATIDAEQATFDRFEKPFWNAKVEALLAPISTAAALLAKMKMIDTATDMYLGDDDYPDVWSCLMRDVEGLA